MFVRNIRAEDFELKGKFVTPAKAAELEAHSVDPGDILITKMGDPPGDVALYPGTAPQGIITADCIKWRLSPMLAEAKFFIYALRSKPVQKQILERTRGVAQKKVSLESFRDIAIPLPPLSDQRRIVAEIEKQFTRLDVGVAALRHVQAHLKRYRAAVLKAACEGRLVQGDHEEWIESTLEGICKSITDGDHQPPPRSHEGIPFLTIGNISSGRLDFSETRFVPESYFARIKPDRVPQINDVIYSVVGATIGIPVLIDTVRRFCFQRHLALLKPSPKVHPKFLWILMASREVHRAAWNRTTGSAQPTLPLKALRSIPVRLPPLAEQTRIVAEAERRLSVVEELEALVSANLQRAARLRQVVLQRAFSGEIGS